jgi:hypothetical protein
VQVEVARQYGRRGHESSGSVREENQTRYEGARKVMTQSQEQYINDLRAENYLQSDGEAELFKAELEKRASKWAETASREAFEEVLKQREEKRIMESNDPDEVLNYAFRSGRKIPGPPRD